MDLTKLAADLRFGAAAIRTNGLCRERYIDSRGRRCLLGAAAGNRSIDAMLMQPDHHHRIAELLLPYVSSHKCGPATCDRPGERDVGLEAFHQVVYFSDKLAIDGEEVATVLDKAAEGILADLEKNPRSTP